MDEFKFPDELEPKSVGAAENADDVEIEVVDDTPPGDKGRKPLDKEALEPSDEELEQYSAGVQKRMKELTHARHDERRAKEQVARERDELARYAQTVAEENKRLKTYVQTGEEAFKGTLKEAATAELEMAKKKYREAHEAFDADAIIEAQQALTTAQLKLERANNFKPAPLQDQTPVVQQQQSHQAPPAIDAKTQSWQARNPWFGPDDEMTAVALVKHKQLVSSGADPRSDAYYAQIDEHMRKRFPDKFEASSDAPETPALKRAASVVAPAKRTTGTTKIKLTASQVAVAKKLGVPLEAYAKQVALQEAQ